MAKFLVTMIPTGHRGVPRGTPKRTGLCPLKTGKTCDDVDGRHHTVLYEIPGDATVSDARDHWSPIHWVTRVEEV